MPGKNQRTGVITKSNPERGRQARNDLSARNFAKNAGHVVVELFELIPFVSKSVGNESSALPVSMVRLAVVVVVGLSDVDSTARLCAAVSGTSKWTHRKTNSSDRNTNKWR